MPTSSCSSPDCHGAVLCRGLCRNHYEQARRRARGLFLRVQVTPEVLAYLEGQARGRGLEATAQAVLVACAERVAAKAGAR